MKALDPDFLLGDYTKFYPHNLIVRVSELQRRLWMKLVRCLVLVIKLLLQTGRFLSILKASRAAMPFLLEIGLIACTSCKDGSYALREQDHLSQALFMVSTTIKVKIQ